MDIRFNVIKKLIHRTTKKRSSDFSNNLEEEINVLNIKQSSETTKNRCWILLCKNKNFLRCKNDQNSNDK